MNLRYAILGTGALGGYYGTLLAATGSDVHFLARSDAAYIKAHGLTLTSPNGNHRLERVQVYQRPEDMPPCDVVIVAFKTTANHVLRTMLPKILTPQGCVLTLQNGLDVEDDLAAIVGPDRVLGGLCFLCSNKTGPGTICHLDYGHITMGALDSAGRHWLAPVSAAFAAAGITVTLTETLRQARWQKLVWNIPFNGLSVVLNTSTDLIVKNPDTRRLALDLMQEVQHGARACGFEISDEHVAKMLSNTDHMRPYAPSMKLDYDAGRPMELETMYARPLNRAAQHHAPLPRITMLYQQLRFLER